ncbi:PHO4-domain-containing protein [Neoconidiobolus thromboides FSU 785]|nr:PHO4-domain-containing protein [Neoconidiobolus thromboides FSU 785]
MKLPLILLLINTIAGLKCGCCNDNCEALGMFTSMNNIPAKCTRKNAIGCVASGDFRHCIKNGGGACVLVSTDGSAFCPELDHYYPSDGRTDSTSLSVIDGSDVKVEKKEEKSVTDNKNQDSNATKITEPKDVKSDTKVPETTKTQDDDQIKPKETGKKAESEVKSESEATESNDIGSSKTDKETSTGKVSLTNRKESSTSKSAVTTSPSGSGAIRTINISFVNQELILALLLTVFMGSPVPHMLDEYTWLFAVTVIVAFIDAYGIGANDVANSFSTSVGSRSITLKQACVIAVFTEFFGAFLLGAETASTISKSIIDISNFEKNPPLLMLAMFCALVGSSTWTLIATRLGWPVSTTHAIVGAVIGVGIAGFGPQSVIWGYDGVAKIVTSWFVSPVTAGIVASIIFLVTKHLVLKHENSFERGLKAIPIYFGLTAAINIFYVIFKNGKGTKSLNIPVLAGITVGVSVAVAIFCWFFIVPYLRRKLKNDENLKWYHIPIMPFVGPQPKRSDISPEVPKEKTYDEEVEPVTFFGKIKRALTKGVSTDIHKVESDHVQEVMDSAVRYDNDTEYMYSTLQVITACMASFAHGSNDVANAIGPLSVVYNIWQSGTINKEIPVPLWVVVFGGIAIDLGLCTYGYNIFKALGTKITYVSPSRGFSMELGTSLTVITASKIGLPVSTTHCITGATAAVGLCNGSASSLNWRMLGWCFFSWFLTLPFSGLTAVSNNRLII